MEEEIIEELFTELNVDEKPIVLNNDLVEYYQTNPELLELDIKNGFFTEKQAKLYRNAVKKIVIDENILASTNSEIGKKFVKSIPNRSLITEEKIREPLKIAGFVEPLLLGTVTSLLGLLYIGYLYLII